MEWLLKKQTSEEMMSSIISSDVFSWLRLGCLLLEEVPIFFASLTERLHAVSLIDTQFPSISRPDSASRTPVLM